MEQELTNKHEMNNGQTKRRALALFSGGLDSSLAIRLVQKQGIEVIALNFFSPFFGGQTEALEKMAASLGVVIDYVDFTADILGLLKNPAHGFGRNMNPCIDCHGLMLRRAGELLEKHNAAFIITGEVLGQRPKSQNGRALREVDAASGYAGLIVRPLSARRLPETEVGRRGWLDRDRLEHIEGRSRKRQMELARAFQITEYPPPAGGCRLTDPGYSYKLKILIEAGLLARPVVFFLLAQSRVFQLENGAFLFVSRNHESNLLFEQYQDEADFSIVCLEEEPGPSMLGFGSFTARESEWAKKLFARYSKAKGKREIPVIVSGRQESVMPLNPESLHKDIAAFQVDHNQAL